MVDRLGHKEHHDSKVEGGIRGGIAGGELNRSRSACLCSPYSAKEVFREGEPGLKHLQCKYKV